MQTTREPLSPRSPMGRRASRRGFTLIELLVVIAILSGLAAILVPIIVSGRRVAKLATTKHLVQQLEAAIGRFSEDWGTYPPDMIPSSTTLKKFGEAGKAGQTFGLSGASSSSGALFYCLGNSNITSLHPYVELQAETQLRDNGNNKLPDIVDPWSGAFVYNRRPFEPSTATLPAIFGTTTMAAFDDGSSPTHNSTSYDLYSLGPPNRPGSEVIGNWE